MGTQLVSAASEGILALAIESDDGLPRLERAVLAQIEDAVARFTATRKVAGCVITGTPQAFAVGANIDEIAQLTASEAFEFSRSGQRVCRAIESSPVPIVAAIRGYCIGGGFDLALACHLRIAAPDAAFAHPGGSLGILTGWGGTQRLTRLVGRARALEILMTGRKLDASEAVAAGLIRAVVAADDLRITAILFARRASSHFRAMGGSRYGEHAETRPYTDV